MFADWLCFNSYSSSMNLPLPSLTAANSVKAMDASSSGSDSVSGMPAQNATLGYCSASTNRSYVPLAV